MPPPKSGNAQSGNSDLLDKDISFEKRDMHKTWPFIQGCALLIAGIAGFIFLSAYVFKNWATWF